MLTFDFETQAIEPRPSYPPEPVGIAYDDGRKIKYLAWGHPSNNNADYVDGVDLLEEHWQGSLLCHNAAFDIAVAHEVLGLPLPHGQRVNDTMFLAFLLDPYGDLGLKPLAERYLGLPPTERDAVRDWLYDNKVVRRNVKRWGAYIAQAPGDLVGRYAIGDVERRTRRTTRRSSRAPRRHCAPHGRRRSAAPPRATSTRATTSPRLWSATRASACRRRPRGRLRPRRTPCSPACPMAA